MAGKLKRFVRRLLARAMVLAVACVLLPALWGGLVYAVGRFSPGALFYVTGVDPSPMCLIVGGLAVAVGSYLIKFVFADVDDADEDEAMQRVGSFALRLLLAESLALGVAVLVAFLPIPQLVGRGTNFAPAAIFTFAGAARLVRYSYEID